MFAVPARREPAIEPRHFQRLRHRQPQEGKLGRMFCPVCGSEYRPEFTRCAECDVDLAPDPPEPTEVEAESIEYEEVLSTCSPIDVAIIKSLLDGEDITYFFQGETVAPYLFHAVAG